MRKTMVTTR